MILTHESDPFQLYRRNCEKIAANRYNHHFYSKHWSLTLCKEFAMEANTMQVQRDYKKPD